MKLVETIDECIKQIKSELRTWKSVKDERALWESFPGPIGGPWNEATIKEVDDSIVEYQKHLDNLYLIKKELNYE